MTDESPFPVKKPRRTGLKVKTVEEDVPIHCVYRMPVLPKSNRIECTGYKVWYHSEFLFV